MTNLNIFVACISQKIKTPTYNEKIIVGDYMYINNLRQLRQEKEITQKMLCEELNFNRNTYNGWERGIVMIPLYKADQLSMFYNVKLSYIFGLETSYSHNLKIKKLNYDILLKNLNSLKKANKQSFQQIASYLMCNRSTCYRYFNGAFIIPIDRLILLSQLYQIDLDKLCGKLD